MKAILLLSSQLFFSLFSFSEVSAIYNNDKVEISWTNPIHIKVDHFIIERSRNGRVFKEIMRVPGSKNIDDIIQYYEIDNNPFKSKAYYRIKQVDINGKMYYSNMAVAENMSDRIKPLFSEFISGNKIKEYKGNDVLIVIIDSKNEQYIAKVDLTQENKKLIVTRSNVVLPTGTYIVIGTSDDIIYGKKITVEGNHVSPVYSRK